MLNSRDDRQLIAAMTLFTVVGMASSKAYTADFSCVSDGSNFTWTSASNWSSCNGVFPNNNASTFDASIGAGTVTLNTAVEIEDLNLGGGNVAHTTNTLQVNGTATIGDGSVYTLTSGTLQGGTWNTAGSGEIRVEGGGIGVLRDVTLGTNAAVIVNGNQFLDLDNSLVNNGDIFVTGPSSTQLRVLDNGFTFDGTGSVTLDDSAGASTAILTTTVTGNDVINSADHTIKGAGRVGANVMDLQNLGTISADVSGGILEIDTRGVSTNAPTLNNDGLMRATNSGTLLLLGSSIDNETGTIAAENDSTVLIANSQIIGGTLQTAGSGTIEIANNSVNTLTGGTSGLTLDGVLNLTGNTDTFVTGTVTNNNAVNLDNNNLGGLSDLIVGNLDGDPATPDATFTGSGTITMDDANGGVRIVGSSVNSLLVNDTDHTIEGAGSIGGNTLYIDNLGVIDANQSTGSGTLTIDTSLVSTSAPSVDNDGEMRASSGGTLLLVGSHIDNIDGSITAGDGSTVELANSQVRGGTLATQGSGTVEVTNNTTNYFTGDAGGLIIDGTLNLTGNTDNIFTNTITNSSNTINLDNNSIGGNTELVINNLDSDPTTADVIFTGGGTLAMTDENGGVFVRGISSNSLLINDVGHTIEGSGAIGANVLFLQNLGDITANISGRTLEIDTTGVSTSPASIDNDGLLQANNGATLRFLNSNIDNVDGVIRADGSGSVVELANAFILGGTLESANGASFEVANATTNYLIGGVNGLTLDGTLNLTGNTDLFISDIITNNGNTITMDNAGLGGNTRLFAINQDTDPTTPDAILSGNGTLQMTSANGNVLITGQTSSSLLVNDSNHTIEGSGGLGANNLFLNNLGTIRANEAGATLTVDTALVSSSAPTLDNDGLMEATDGGILLIQGTPLDNSGGTLRAADGSTVLISNSSILGGLLESTGSGSFDVVNNTSNVFDGGASGMTNNAVINLSGNTDNFFANTITNNNTINLDNVQGVATTEMIAVDLDSNSSTVDTVFDGNGVISMTSSNGNVTLRGQTTATRVLNSVDHTIEGSGSLGAGLLFLQNEGLVDANENGGVLVLDGSGVSTSVPAAVDNTGTLQASNGGELLIFGSHVNNTGGTIRAEDSSAVTLQNSQITGGTIETAGSGAVGVANNTVNYFTGGVSGLVIDGTVDLTGNTDNFFQDTITNNGTINLDHNSIGGTTQLFIFNKDSDSTTPDAVLSGNGSLVMTDANGPVQVRGQSSTSLLVNDTNHTIEGSGALGSNFLHIQNEGTIDANDGGILTIDTTGVATTSPTSMVNNGTTRASNNSELRFTGSAVQNNGLIEALDGSSVNYESTSATVNNMSGDLVGGTWRAEDTGGGATITLRGDPITTNSADVTLKGANALIQVGSTSIEDTLGTNNGSLRLQDGQNFNAIGNSGNFVNTGTGLLEVTDSIFESNTLQNDGNISSFGNSSIVSTFDDQIVGTGDIDARFGTLTISNGVDISGTLTTHDTSPAVGTVDLSGSPPGGAENTVGSLVNNGALILGSDDVRVLNDYSNANFGAGNSFDNRANVTGTGAIIGDSASQLITGDVTSTGANTVNIDLGNVRGGTSVTANYQIANDGTGADIRGAIQTSVNGGNITDGRLSGAGVTAANFGPISAGSDTGNLEVTFDATNGGALSGQAIAVASNFDNIVTDIITINGTATTLAQGSASPNSDPVNLGNFRVGGINPSQDFAVENTAPADASTERLGIASPIATTGNFDATSNLGAGFIAGGDTQSAAVTASVSGGAAGLNQGSMTLQYVTNGELIDSSFTSINANQETINLEATGFNAAAGSASPDTVMFANTRVGGSLSQDFTVSNTAAAGAFSEDLNASFGADTGDATSNGGSVNGLLAGGSNNSNMSASLDTSTAGAKSGTVTFNYDTTGAVNGVSNGLGVESVGSQAVTLSGNVYQVAEGTLNTASLNFGTVQVGQSVSQDLSFTNSATGPSGFVEDLLVSFGASSGTNGGLIEGTGSIMGLVAGATNNTDMTVSVNTSSAATVDGAIAINYTSAGAVNGVSNGLGQLALDPGSFPVSGIIEMNGQVIDQAMPVINNNPINLGNLRVDSTSPQVAVSVSNMSTGNPQAALDASIAGNGDVTSNGGSFDNLAPGGTDMSSLLVGVNTSVAGAINGTATLGFVSDASNVGGCAPNCEMVLPSQDVNVTAAVYRLADPILDTTDVTLAARVGDALPTANVSVTNNSPDMFTEGLDAEFASPSSGFTATGMVDNLVASGTDNSNLSVGLASTATSQDISGSVDVDFDSTGEGTTGEADISVGSATVNLLGKVYEIAEAAVDTFIDFGTVRVNDTAEITETIANIATGALVDNLEGDFVDSALAPFSADAGDLPLGLASGDSADLNFALDTGTAGIFDDAVELMLMSTNDDLADLALDSIEFSLMGTVNALANPEFVFDSGDGGLTGGDDLYFLTFDTVSSTTSTILDVALSLFNSIPGPADFLDGLFDLSSTGPFGTSGFGPVENVAAGDGVSGLNVSFDTTGLGPGLFSGSIFLNPTSTFTGLMDIDLDPIELRLSARIRGSNPVPVPSSVLLFGLGGIMLMIVNRRRYSAQARS